MNSLLKNPIVHGVVVAVLFIVPMILGSGSQVLNLTIGGVLTMALQALKNFDAGLTLGGHAR